ncbi:MAG: hypothetical protein ACRC6H_05060 [Culicoidibacterales bacterium]
MMRFWTLQREINKTFLYGMTIAITVAFLSNMILMGLNDPKALIFLIVLLAFWVFIPMLVFPMMAIRMIRFIHRVGALQDGRALFWQMTNFFAVAYTLISAIVSSAIFLNLHWLPASLGQYLEVFNLQQGENSWYWFVAFGLTILSAIALISVVTIVYMLYRSQLLNQLSWWKKLAILVGVSTVIFIIIGEIFSMIAGIFPMISLVPLTLANEQETIQLSTSAIQAVLQMVYVYLLVKINIYIYQTLYESEY